MAYLQIHPKVYWIWNHRKWCLEHVPLGPATETESPSETLLVQGGKKTEDGMGETTTSEGWRCGFWKGELAVIEALLDADPRNCAFPYPYPTPMFYHQSTQTDSQSTHGIIVDTSSHPSPLHSPHPEPQRRNCNIPARKSKAISVISQLGIVGLKSSGGFGRAWIRNKWMRRRIRVGSLPHSRSCGAVQSDKI